MTNLISGKEALIALANGEEVEYYKHEWLDVNRLSVRDLTSLDSMYKFRLKPRTITINGIEIPKPFEPKLGERYYVLQPCNESGWMGEDCVDMEFENTWSQFGAWRTEDEIKQVVEALRQVFGNF